MRLAAFALLALTLGGAAFAQDGARLSRCWEYARAGNTEAALKDCDEAVRVSPSAAAYEQRAFVHLMGRKGLDDIEKAVADFSAAVALEPNRALSLYGRGMARLMSGDSAGQNEMEAATMMQADVAEAFKQYGAR